VAFLRKPPLHRPTRAVALSLSPNAKVTQNEPAVTAAGFFVFLPSSLTHNVGTPIGTKIRRETKLLRGCHASLIDFCFPKNCRERGPVGAAQIGQLDDVDSSFA
jgi:hypothetical protein